nr:hypothetical protein [Caballeronia telluris]
MLDHHQRRAAPFAADREALQEAQRREKDRRAEADAFIRRQKADQEGPAAHHQQAQHEHRLAADLVAVVSEHDAAHRPRDEADRKGRERRDRARDRIDRGKEQLVEDQRGRRSEDEKVVPLEGRAYRAGERTRRMSESLNILSPELISCLVKLSGAGQRNAIRFRYGFIRCDDK